MRVGELEAGLLELFPASQAESWDRTGMLVGNPADGVCGVAVALDPTVEAIRFAVSKGANVLVTHHPLFLDPPEDVKPAATGGSAVGARIWEAIASGVSIISFHTALDASPRAATVLSAPLGLAPNGDLLEPLGSSSDCGCISDTGDQEPNGAMPEPLGLGSNCGDGCKSDAGGLEQGGAMPGPLNMGSDCGYGRICDVDGLELGELVERCRAAFGHPVRMWGDASRKLQTACLWTGAAGTSPRACVVRGVDAFVCGEVKYHEALDACEQGLCIVELGHDVSEQVFCPILVESVVEVGTSRDSVHLMDLPRNWR